MSSLSWRCLMCTFDNTDMEATFCNCCTSKRPPSDTSEAVASSIALGKQEVTQLLLADPIERFHRIKAFLDGLCISKLRQNQAMLVHLFFMHELAACRLSDQHNWHLVMCKDPTQQQHVILSLVGVEQDDTPEREPHLLIENPATLNVERYERWYQTHHGRKPNAAVRGWEHLYVYDFQHHRMRLLESLYPRIVRQDIRSHALDGWVDWVLSQTAICSGHAMSDLNPRGVLPGATGTSEMARTCSSNLAQAVTRARMAGLDMVARCQPFISESETRQTNQEVGVAAAAAAAKPDDALSGSDSMIIESAEGDNVPPLVPVSDLHHITQSTSSVSARERDAAELLLYCKLEQLTEELETWKSRAEQATRDAAHNVKVAQTALSYAGKQDKQRTADQSQILLLRGQLHTIQKQLADSHKVATTNPATSSSHTTTPLTTTDTPNNFPTQATPSSRVYVEIDD